MMIILAAAAWASSAHAELYVSASGQAYTSGQPLFVFGKAEPGETIILRLFGPDDTIINFDQITTKSDGTFQHVMLVWPPASITFPYGTYTVEVLSTSQGGISDTINVSFADTTDSVDAPIRRSVNLLVFAPETAATGNAMRVFVQTTSDGLLVGNDPQALLDTTHVHLPDGTVQDISGTFRALHQGLFYADYSPEREGTHVFHAVAFSQGTISHGSAATIVLKQDIGGISDQILSLDQILDETSGELNQLGNQVGEFEETLRLANDNIEGSVTSVSESVRNIEEASSQLNSLFFPVVALIAVIVALQIATLARSR